jgi:NADPH:quinone reductase-like Zn-dependent oxidoreductase
VRGAVVAIDDPRGLDVLPLKPKSITWHWEFMFTRPLYEPESTYQHELLDETSRLVDAGVLRTTLTTRLSPLDAQTMRRAHRRVESSTTIGKVVVTRNEADSY